MGGYGALRLALGYPERYVSAVSHSGAVFLGQVKPKDEEYKRIFGAKSKNTDHDLQHLAAKAQAAGKLPALRIDCGVDDFLLSQNQAFHRQLIDLKIPHEYEEFPGAHTWDYWDLHVREAIAFHARHLKLRP
jgi:S-formylglutathione hydrolase FrmB